MLSWAEILRYVKRQIGHPHVFIELSDEEIIESLQDACIRKFSNYFPDKRTMGLNCEDSTIKVHNRKDSFYVNDPDGQEILSIDNFIPQMGDNIILGHPWWGAWNHDTIPEEMALGAFKANNLRQFSRFNYTFRFYPPNQIRISPEYKKIATLEYSRIHLNDLSTIPPTLTTYFRDFCLASLQMILGRLRKYYTEVSTPFGTIPLNADDMFSQGETLYNSLIEKFETSSAPFVVFDVG